MSNRETDKQQTSSSRDKEYEYVSAGVREKPGTIPLWLMAVILGLFIWGGYYLATYWNPH